MRKISFFIPLLLVTLFPIKQALAITQNQINAEVQIVCPDSYGNWFSGSGTIIDPKGIILTNKHVVTDQFGGDIKICFVGFLSSITQEPNFGTKDNPNFAEVKYVTESNDMDAAILYLNNSTNKIYSYVDIWGSNSNTLAFGDKLEAIGFPTIGGSTITYTSGDFSGFGSKSAGTQNYIKTTAILEHGNSGGSAYNSSGQFIGIPTMVVTGSLNSISYVLSVNSIKNWLSGLLGSAYKQDILQGKPTIATQPGSIQNDVTPPNNKQFALNLYNVDENGNVIHSATVGESVPVSIYEFPRVKIGWYADCSDAYCIKDNESSIKGYYYYFGDNISADPVKHGEYISSEDLLKGKDSEVILPNVFTALKNQSNYFILKAKDAHDNISDSLFTFEYIYELNRFKDIENISVKDSSNKLIGNIGYPKASEIPMCDKIDCKGGGHYDYIIKEIYTNQDTLYLEPNFGYGIDGIAYNLSYGEDTVWVGSVRKGIITPDTYLKVDNIKNHKVVNVCIKPGKGSVNEFTGYCTLRIHYRSNFNEKIKIVNRQNYYEMDRIKYPEIYSNFNLDYEKSGINDWGELKYSANDSSLISKLLGYILLQVESHGEAWYVNPLTNSRSYMKDGDVAYQMMRSFGQGIADSDLSKISSASTTNEIKSAPSICASNSLANRMKGKILLQVQQHGEAWYVYPKNCRMIYMKDGAAAYEIMRYLGQGIANADLAKITADE
ncbi:MAG: S1C family serine protease [Patescibacteria group bacterium]|nr:S1C family serine protease [Patescibacteria group bacterium]